jgi:hypothetical protein
MRRRTVIVGGMVLLAAGGTAAAIKLTQQDAKRIEEHTGLPPDQLEDDDLQQAMHELNIQQQEMTEADKAALAGQEGSSGVSSQPGQAAAPATSSPAGSDEPDYLSELEKLAELRDKGIITEDEFEAKKQQLLGL